jgi:cell division protein FtsX
VWLRRLWPGRPRTIHAFLAAILAGALAVGGLILISDESHALPTLTIFISPKASLVQIYAIRNALFAMPGLSSCTYWSKAADYREAMRLVGNSIGGHDLRVESTPPSFRCHLSFNTDLTAAVRRFRDQPGVYTVVGSP